MLLLYCCTVFHHARHRPFFYKTNWRLNVQLQSYKKKPWLYKNRAWKEREREKKMKEHDATSIPRTIFRRFYKRSLQLFTDKDKACSLGEYKCTQVIVSVEVVSLLDNFSNSVQWCVLSLVLQGSVGYLNSSLTFYMTEYDALNAGWTAELLPEQEPYNCHVLTINMKGSSLRFEPINTV